jgi:8-oxo-dGTP diphosphatase
MTSAHHQHHAHGPIEYRFCPRCGGGLERRAIKAIEPKRLVCRACSFIFYQDPKVVAGTIFTLDSRVVLLRRGVEPAIGKWVFPGGYVDRGETLEEAALRETREESQLEVVIASLLNVYSYPRSPNVIIVYAAQIVGGDLAAGDESVEAATFLPGEIPWHDLAFDSTRDALKDYIKIFMKE